MDGSDELRVRMHFNERPPKDADPYIMGYIRAFAREAGWSIHGGGVRKDHIAFSASRATSSDERKRWTRPSGSSESVKP